MLIKDSIDKEMFSLYKEDEEDLDFLIEELEELNQRYRQLETLMEELEKLNQGYEQLEILMEESEELNQGYKQGTQSWDL